MKRNTLEKLYLCLKYELPEIILSDYVLKNAKNAIDRMLEISLAAGL
jgi:quinolinate synthase